MKKLLLAAAAIGSMVLAASPADARTYSSFSVTVGNGYGYYPYGYYDPYRFYGYRSYYPSYSRYYYDPWYDRRYYRRHHRHHHHYRYHRWDWDDRW